MLPGKADVLHPLVRCDRLRLIPAIPESGSDFVQECCSYGYTFDPPKPVH